MKEYQMRVISELKGLDLSLEKISRFINSKVYKNIPDGESKSLIREQQKTMADLSLILTLRVAGFNNKRKQ